jgi:hypothetical protein
MFNEFLKSPLEELYNGLLKLKGIDLNSEEKKLWTGISITIIDRFKDASFKDLRKILWLLEKESEKNKNVGLTSMEYKMIEESIYYMLKYYEKIPIFVLDQLKAPMGMIEGRENDFEMRILEEAHEKINKLKGNGYCGQYRKDFDINDQMTYGELIQIYDVCL